jgi:hypothetical protein
MTTSDLTRITNYFLELVTFYIISENTNQLELVK